MRSLKSLREELTRHFKKSISRKREEPTVWASSEAETVSSKQSVKAILLQRLDFRPRFPKIKYRTKYVKSKQILSGVLAVLYLLSGIFTFPNPFALLPLISAFFLFDYVWLLRRVKWLGELRGT